MKKKTKIIIVSTICAVVLVIVTMLTIGFAGVMKEEYKIYQAEQIYFSDKSADNLYDLCNVLFKSESYDKIIRYYEDLLFTGKYNQINKPYTQEALNGNYDYILNDYLMAYIMLGDKLGFESELNLHFKDYRTEEFKYHYIQETFQQNLKDEPETIKYICSEYFDVALKSGDKIDAIRAAAFANIWYEILGDSEKAEEMSLVAEKLDEEVLAEN